MSTQEGLWAPQNFPSHLSDPSLPSPRSTQIKTYSWDNAQVLLVGNKCDMEDERVVSSEKGRQLAEHLGELGRGDPPAMAASPQLISLRA